MKCKFVRNDGHKCKANAMTTSEFCYLHNPDISEEEKKLNQAKGGKGRLIAVSEPLPMIDMDGIKGITLLLQDTIIRVRNNEMDEKKANCIGFLSGQLLKTYEISEGIERMDKIKNALNNL